jgi:hypothetical protein
MIFPGAEAATALLPDQRGNAGNSDQPQSLPYPPDKAGAAAAPIGNAQRSRATNAASAAAPQAGKRCKRTLHSAFISNRILVMAWARHFH